MAVADDPEVRTLPDDDLPRAATAAGRAVVTDDARDFDRLVRTWAAADEYHPGVIFTSPRRFHRGGRAYPDDLGAGLAAVLAGPPSEQTGWVHLA